ncbi:hypothetical protein [Streptomyces sp. MMBL 11-3]|uniref:hypothetical protein n=1 Tax=Streptomyces sp. MMBL 11-3 TaxID=3382639 RepID=UPI0039B3BC53
MGEAAGTGGRAVPPHAHGEFRSGLGFDVGAVDDDHRDPRPSRVLALGARPQVIPSRLVGTSPHTEETFSVKLPPKVPV